MEPDFRKSCFFDEKIFFEKVSIPKIFEKSHFFFDHFLVVRKFGKILKIFEIFGIEIFSKNILSSKKKLFRKSGSITFLYHPKSALGTWLRADQHPAYIFSRESKNRDFRKSQTSNFGDQTNENLVNFEKKRKSRFLNSLLII